MTLKKIILHAGLPKTGTSALQELLADNRTSLAQNGFWYPHVSNPIPHPNHRYLIEELRNSPELSKTQAALDEAAKRDCHTVIFSIEGLSGHVTKIREDAAARLNTLSKGAKIEIVVVLREPDRWLVSMYRQSIINPPLKSGNLSPLENTYCTDELFSTYSRRPEVTEVCDRSLIQERFGHLFPEAKLTFIDYDREILARLLSVLGIDLFINQKGSSLSNITPSDAYIEILRQSNGLSSHRQDYVFLRALVSAEIDDRHAELARYKLPAYWKLLGNVVAAQRILGRVHYQPNPPLKVDEKSFADACERMVKRARKALFRKFAWAKR